MTESFTSYRAIIVYLAYKEYTQSHALGLDEWLAQSSEGKSLTAAEHDQLRDLAQRNLSSEEARALLAQAPRT